MKKKLSRMWDNLILLAMYTITNGAILKLAIWMIDIPSIQFTFWQCVGIMIIGRCIYAWLILPMHRQKMMDAIRDEMKEEWKEGGDK